MRDLDAVTTYLGVCVRMAILSFFHFIIFIIP